MESLAVVLEKPGKLALRSLGLADLGPADVMVEVHWSGISTGTERLLFTGTMPPFPGLGYPLVPGYESVGRVVEAGPQARDLLGLEVFVPGASCWQGARGLFGGAGARLVVPAARVIPLAAGLAERGVLLALAATAHHALGDGPLPDLIVGHGALGRLLARLVVARGGAPRVWETNPVRMGGASGYAVEPPGRGGPFRRIIDASGADAIVDRLLSCLAKGGEIVLAGFYDRISFAFPPAFLAELRLVVAAEFTSVDLRAVADLAARGVLDLDGLVTHVAPPVEAAAAYQTAFGDPACIKMVLDWREVS
ncbi:chlorophyll synthesis pathway protein BchC [Thermaurantiacus sp.]